MANTIVRGIAAALKLKNLPDQSKMDSDSQGLRTPSPEGLGRSSFSSIREQDTALSQTFTLSKVSSYHNFNNFDVAQHEQAIDDLSDYEEDDQPLSFAASSVPTSIATPEPSTMIETQFMPPATKPHSRLHGNWWPADSYRGWKEINVKGKLASKSFGDLASLSPRSQWEEALSTVDEQMKLEPVKESVAGNSTIERLPQELYDLILANLVLDIPPNGLEKRNMDLISLLVTSKTMKLKTDPTVHRNVTIPHSRIFSKFLKQTAANPHLGRMVKRLDFSHFNPSTLFMTASERAQAKNLTVETLHQCMQLTTHLQEFLGQEYIDDDISVDVLRALLIDIETMRAVDFCGCTSAPFKNAFVSLVADTEAWPEFLRLRRVSFHKCITLPSSVFDTILPRLRKATHLDLAGTKVTDKALASIPHTARITHLNLAKCNSLTAENTIAFLSTHPAVQKLEVLSLGMDARTHQLFEAEDVTALLPVLPKSLKSLSLKGAKMTSDHLEQLIPLTKHLEELAMGRGLRLDELNRLILPDPAAEPEEQMKWTPHTLRFLDLTDMHGAGSTGLDLSALYNDSVLLKRMSPPLQVIEISDDVLKRLKPSQGPITRFGWRVSEVHSRSWLVRNQEVGPGTKRDDGSRPWKMGAKFWGMRKLPVAEVEVGGMYGSFMFGRKL